MRFANTAVVIAVLVSLTLPCASAIAADPHSENYNYPLAQTAAEDKFIEIADKSCNLAMKNGFVMTEAGYSTIFPAQPKGATPSRLAQPGAFVTLDATGKNVIRYYDYVPSLCEPTDLNRQVPLLKAGMKTTEHRLTKLTSTKFAWFSHHGSSDLNKTIFNLSKGLITGWSLWNGSTFKIQYGPLSQEQQATYDQISGH